MRIDMITRIARKELALLFSSPIAYLFLAAFLGVTLFVFFWGEAFFARNIADVRPMFEWLPVLLIFLASALTMRAWSDERRAGTLELVVTVPASSTEFVLGKFLACWGLLALALALTLPLPISISLLGDVDLGPVFAGYLAAALLGAAYLGIGLCASARTDNQIVALILATFGCGVFYLVGSPALTDLFGNRGADWLRAVGAGSRFESITRGVLDLRDLYFYVSVLAVFLALNVYAVDAHGWAADGDAKRHRGRRVVLGLVAANFLVANFWLSSVYFLRWDVTEGNQYSISDATRSYLRQLREPLLVRGYFSAKTHPLLAPLTPRLQDLLTEYEVAGDGRVRVEFIDPATEPELEDEANTKYGIRPVPFQVADRYQAALVSSYFDVLVQYGDEYEVLSFNDLIEVKVHSETDVDVRLKNPEYDVTRAIKKVLYGFQGGGSIFDNVAQPVKFTGYVSADERLPAALSALRPQLRTVLDEMAEESGGKLTSEIVDPDAEEGEVARRIAADYGFRPMAASLFATNTFYFYLTLSDGETVVQMPLPDPLDADGLRRNIEEGLKRFATGLLKSVALSAPQGMPPYMQQMPQMQQPQGNEFQTLREVVGADFNVETANLDAGAAPAEADVLLVVDPADLDAKSVFAIDQFLMRGGTVVVAAGSYRTTVTQQSLYATPVQSGLADWLAHHGIGIDDAFVLDPRNAAFPLPQVRDVPGGFRFVETRLVDYPYFIDVRGDGLNPDVAFTAGVPQITMAWASPVEVDAEANKDRAVTTLLTSSPESWRSRSTDVMPKAGAAYLPEGERQANTLAVLVEGRFESFFDESPLAAPEASDADDAADAAADDTAEDEAAPDTLGTITTVIEKSPESARLIVIGSAAFVADQTVRMIGAAGGTMYANPLELMANIVDWSVEDESLLGIRSRGHFNRTLPPMREEEQRVWEYANYLFAIVGMALVFGVSHRRRTARRQAYRLQLEASS